MPVMELWRPDLHLRLISGIWGRLWAYMLWPDDELQRKAHCAKPYVTALSSIDQKSQADPDYAAAYWIVHGAFRVMGGWSGVDHALSAGSRPRGRACRTAAAVLDIVRRIPDNGSVNKAIHVIEHTAASYNLIASRAGILSAWKSHRGVAHLGISLILAGKFHDHKEFDDPRRLRRFLGIAADYEEFAISYRAPRQKRPLIDPAEMWTIPIDLRPTLRLRRPLSPLPGDMLAALATYRPPKQL
jgi:hypothetical protein